MKNILKIATLTVLLFTFPLFIQAQPHPNGGNAPTAGNNKVGSNNGSGAPVGNGTLILMMLAGAYGGRKAHMLRRTA